MVEEWREIDEAPLYEVSSHGRVRNRLNGSKLVVTDNGSGRKIVGLRNNGKRLVRSVAILVARHFLPDPTGDNNLSPMHKDGDLSNCRADNLIWRPRWFVAKRTLERKNGPTQHVPVQDMLTGKVYANAFEAAQEFHSLEARIDWACDDQWSRTAHGRSWRRAPELAIKIKKN